MNKRNCYFLVILIFCQFIHGVLKAQSYPIESFEGNKTRINLNYKPFSKTLRVSCSGDTLFLNDYTGTIGVSNLNKNFLEIIYNVYGGSGLELRKTLLLSVIKNKVNVSMLVTSYVGLASLDKKGLYKLKLSLTGDNTSNYKLNIDIHDELQSKSSPQTDYSHNKQVSLRFDAGLNIFYSGYKDVSDNFKVYDPRDQQTTSRQVKGKVPVIPLVKNDYYYIKEQWYESTGDNDLNIDYSRSSAKK
jgi:hypothetical protein